MKILFGYSMSEGYNHRYSRTKALLSYIERLNKAGFEVKSFCMNYSDSFPVIPFRVLDKFWKWGDRRLFSLYDKFLREAEDCDVFYNSVGVNFHPEFVKQLSIFTVFGCNDDPESSDALSKPVAYAYDLCAVGNIAELDTYRSWGCRNVVWQPMGIYNLMFDPHLTYEDILHGKRDIDLFMLIDRLSPYRKERCDAIANVFPEGHFYGRGWERGYLKEGEEIEFLKRSKIGINIHNSTGPINIRLFYLPANGVLQICDNKSNLAKIFKIDEEVVGFDSIEECIEKCKYYIAHPNEARRIAANGWLRVHKDYNEIAVFQRLVDNISKYQVASKSNVSITLKKKSNLRYRILSVSLLRYLELRKMLASILRR